MNYYSRQIFINFLINASLALAIGFVIWSLHLWTAGDAKLFFAFAALIPDFSSNHYSFLISLLSNIFVPISIFFLLNLLLKANYKKSLFHLKKTINAKRILSLIAFIFGFSWVINMLLNLVGIEGNLFLVLLGSFFLYYLAERIIKIEMSEIANYIIKLLRFPSMLKNTLRTLVHSVFDIFYLSLALSVIRLLADGSVYSLKFIFEFLKLILLFLLLRVFLLSLSSEYFTKKLELKDLRSGMIPAENVFKFEGKYFKKPMPFSIIGLAKRKTAGESIFEIGEALSKEEVARLQALQKKLPFKTLRIQATMPFAPFLFLGALLTIIFQGGFMGHLL